MLEEKICPLYFQGVPMADAILFPREKTQQQKEDEITQHNLEFNIDEKELTLGAKIGGGSYGAVFAGKWLGTDVAIKQLYFNSLPDKVLKEFHKECNLMRQFRHPNIVLFLGSCSKPPNLYLVTELLQKGSLFDIYHNENQSMNPIRHFGLVVQVCMYVQYVCMYHRYCR
jgi:serine/threonine protein kinase